MNHYCALSASIYQFSWDVVTQSGSYSFVGLSKHKTKKETTVRKSLAWSALPALRDFLHSLKLWPKFQSWLCSSVFSSGKSQQAEAMSWVWDRAKSRSSGLHRLGPLAFCAHSYPCAFLKPPFWGLGNGAEIQYLCLRVAQTISSVYMEWPAWAKHMVLLNKYLLG